MHSTRTGFGDTARRAAIAIAAGFLAASASAQSVTTALQEGPHLRWLDDTRAEVLTVRDGAAEIRAVTVDEPIELCGEPGEGRCLTVDDTPPAVGPWTFASPTRIAAIGDLHGQYDAAHRMLQVAGVIDDAGRWSFGDGHLVFCGDVVDRGPRTTEALWMIYRLEQEAEAAGGRVHMILGNHEAMIIAGDLRYAHPDDVAAAETLGLTYDDLVAADMELGRWLRSKHAIVRIGDTAFVHAGIGPSFMTLAREQGWDVAAVNRLVRQHVDTPRDRRAAEVAAVLGSGGPLWYRGYLLDDEKYEPASRGDVEAALEWLGARRVVVAHTEMPGVTSKHGGLVIAIDVPVEERAEMLLIDRERGAVRLTVGGASGPLN